MVHYTVNTMEMSPLQEGVTITILVTLSHSLSLAFISEYFRSLLTLFLGFLSKKSLLLNVLDFEFC